MKRVLIAAFIVISGCSSTKTGDDHTLLCAVSLDEQCLQWDRFQSLRSVQQMRAKP